MQKKKPFCLWIHTWGKSHQTLASERGSNKKHIKKNKKKNNLSIKYFRLENKFPSISVKFETVFCQIRNVLRRSFEFAISNNSEGECSQPCKRPRMPSVHAGSVWWIHDLPGVGWYFGGYRQLSVPVQEPLFLFPLSSSSQVPQNACNSAGKLCKETPAWAGLGLSLRLGEPGGCHYRGFGHLLNFFHSQDSWWPWVRPWPFSNVWDTSEG